MAANSKGKQIKQTNKNDIMPGFFERGPGGEGIILDKPAKSGKAPAKKPGTKKK